MNRTAFLATLVAAALLAAGCGGSDGPGDTRASPSETTVNPSVNSDVADELHVHSNPEHTFKIEATPGQSFQFTVNVPGKVDVELHQLKKTIATIAVQ